MPILKRAPKDILSTVAEAGPFKVFLSVLKAAGLAETLRASAFFTVFAPTDDAFAKLSESTLHEWFRPQSKAKLKGILTYHLLSGKLRAADIFKSKSLKTLQGTALTLRLENNRMYVNNATVLETDLACDNGFIHVLDTVVVPR